MLFSSMLPVVAQSPSTSDLAGHYYLSGIQEVGSELLLRPNGEFEWMLSYGAEDLVAAGTWSANDKTLTLKSGNAADKITFRLADKDDWNDRATHVLEHQKEQEAREALKQSCPLPSLMRMDTTSIEMAGNKHSDSAADIQKARAVAIERGQKAQSALDRLKSISNWQNNAALVEEVDKALSDYRDSQDALLDAGYKNRDNAKKLLTLKLPQECILGDWEKETAAFRGVAFIVFDTKHGLKGNGIQVRAHYNEGDTKEDTVQGEFAFLPLPNDKTMTAVTLHVPGRGNDEDVTLPVNFATPSIQLVEADLGSLVRPPFTQLVLTINPDHSLTAEGQLSRGKYEKATPQPHSPVTDKN